MVSSTSTVWQRAAKPVLWALIALPAFLAFNYVFRFGVNSPYWDDFELSPTLDKLYAGRLTLGDLLAQHNEHRILFPRLLMLAAAHFSRYNVLVEMYLSWGLLCGILALLWVEHRRTFGTSAGALALFVPVAWLTCTLRQGENLLWGWQCQIFLYVLSFLLAAWFARDAARSRWRQGACLASAVVSTFSFAAGLAVWPFLVVYCLLLSRRPEGGGRPLLRLAALSGGVGALATGLYLRGYHRPGQNPSTGYVLSHPGEGLHFLLTTLGSPLSAGPGGAAALGAVLLALAAPLALVWARGGVDGERGAFALPLLLLGASTALMVTVGRAGAGLEAALPSRYTTMTALGVVGVYRVVLAVKAERLRWALGAVVGVLLLAGGVAEFDGTYAYGRLVKQARLDGLDRLAHYRSLPDQALFPVCGNPKKLRSVYAPLLEAHRLSIFAAGDR